MPHIFSILAPRPNCLERVWLDSKGFEITREAALLAPYAGHEPGEEGRSRALKYGLRGDVHIEGREFKVEDV